MAVAACSNNIYLNMQYTCK